MFTHPPEDKIIIIVKKNISGLQLGSIFGLLVAGVFFRCCCCAAITISALVAELRFRALPPAIRIASSTPAPRPDAREF